jgi:hypothetical protein
MMTATGIELLGGVVGATFATGELYFLSSEKLREKFVDKWPVFITTGAAAFIMGLFMGPLVALSFHISVAVLMYTVRYLRAKGLMGPKHAERIAQRKASMRRVRCTI